MYNLLDKICKGQGTQADLTLLESLCDLVANTSLCGLGKASPSPIRSTMRFFRQEYLDRLVDAETDKVSE
jgi:bidirectional [NiFe] hydrogenase diaphorase subunit